MAGQTFALGAGALGQREIGGDKIRLLADGTSADHRVGKMAELATTLGRGVVSAWGRRAAAENLQFELMLSRCLE